MYTNLYNTRYKLILLASKNVECPTTLLFLKNSQFTKIDAL